jgi:hypothetical protein
MGYFDALTASWFGTDASGRTLYFPWGVLGAGYITENDEQAARLRRFLKWEMMIALSSCSLVRSVSGDLPTLLFLLVYTIWRYFRFKVETKGLAKSTEKWADATPNTFALAVFAGASLFALVAFSTLIFTKTSKILPILGFACALFCLVWSVRLLRATSDSDKPPA